MSQNVPEVEARTASDEIREWDRRHLWHPYSSMSDPAPARVVSGASGVHLNIDGREVVDAMASWWTAIHGYRHPVLDAAVTRQLESMSHVMFGGLTHAPAVSLGRRLTEIAPGRLDHVFFADSGSVSVEVALKMALQYQRGSNRPSRTKFLTIRGGYHGDTCGCMGVCDPDGGMHSIWRGFLPEHIFAPRPPADPKAHIVPEPSSPVGSATPAAAHAQAVSEWGVQFSELAARHTDDLAGIIVEPLLQGAGGMYAYDAECLRIMRRVADEHDLVFIADEIATGFGRTGALFACEAAGVEPDVLCVGKALTGGYLTLAATMCTADVARRISASDAGVLMHGPTFMANPLACAVAGASLDLLLEQDWAANVRRIGEGLRRELASAATISGVHQVRTLGAVGVIELDHDVDVVAATEAALDAGAWLRPFRNLIYTMPPYVCSDADLATIGAAMTSAARVG